MGDTIPDVERHELRAALLDVQRWEAKRENAQLLVLMANQQGHAASEAYNRARKEIWTRHGMADDDQIDLATGAILRQHPPLKVVEAEAPPAAEAAK